MILEEMLEAHFAYSRALDAAWRWFRRSKAPSISLSEVVARVQLKCPDADPQEIRREIEDRLSRTRS
jgi:hypothetical protein